MFSDRFATRQLCVQRGMIELKGILDKMASLPEFVGVNLNGPNAKGNFGNTPMHVAAIWNDVKAGEVLLGAGADVNARGEHGYAPIHEAAEQGNIEFVRFLLKAKARTDLKNDDGETAAEIAEMQQYAEIARLLHDPNKGGL